MTDKTENASLLKRIAEALERLSPPPAADAGLDRADAFVWNADTGRPDPVAEVARVDLALIKGVDRVRDILLDNTRRFAAGLPANNALLWGARGMGKSSLVKAAHAAVNAEQPASLILIEIHREDIESLPRLMTHVRAQKRRAVIFCDDLSFDHDDTSYKSLKAVLEGGIEGRPRNVIFYATSNRRHLMPREGYASHYALAIDAGTLREEAIEWAATRGSRSGRVAWQFVQDLAGRLGQTLD